MKDNSLAVEVFIDNRYPENAREHIIESGRRDLLYKLSDSIMDGRYYCICFRRETQKEQFGIRERMRFDVMLSQTYRPIVYDTNDMPTGYIVRSSIDELKSRVILWLRRARNVVLSSFGKKRKR